MHDTILISGRDSVLVAIPFVFMLFLNVFRLDETLARPRAATARSRPTSGMNEAGEPILRDPDGRLVEPAHPKRNRTRLSASSWRISTRGPSKSETGNQIGSRQTGKKV